MRLAAKLWHAYVRMPAVIEKYRSSDLTLFPGHRIMTPTSNGNTPSRLRFSGRTCRKLADVLKDYTADGSRVLFVFHPHIQHLKPDASGRLWNDLVSAPCKKCLPTTTSCSSTPPRR